MGSFGAICLGCYGLVRLLGTGAREAKRENFSFENKHYDDKYAASHVLVRDEGNVEVPHAHLKHPPARY